ncbi:hypothetical protein K2173_001587 [Erythroxylum novogranatense]|uniref:Uncharacterized protein n=1 Tax=Erythroxylum novogranatense TaxID=1862640 RepID=A0AAV8T577_9ROSI|nr:hypothetical protein K2173_001587 [Erythroxylum novogranatense]
MAERKLNFSAPLLSVRRFSTATKASDGEGKKKIDNLHVNRRGSLPFHGCEVHLDQVTEPVAVPFQWEQIPGRPKHGTIPEYQVFEQASASQKFPPGKGSGENFEYQNEFSDKIGEFDFSKEGVHGQALLESRDNYRDVYSDAHDTISPTDSFSMNCSAAALSGYDGVSVKPSGSFSTDPLTRDFMMSRFLPAAKAMALEPPHYASRKQSTAIVQAEAVAVPGQSTKVVNVTKPPQTIPKGSSIIPCHGLDLEEEEEEEESDDDYDNYSTSHSIATKGCGLLPRLCFKNSLSILNPLSGLKVRTQGSMAHIHNAVKPKKASSTKTQSQNWKKHTGDVEKPNSRAQSPRLSSVLNKLGFGSNRFSFRCDHQEIGRTSPFRRAGASSSFGRDQEIGRTSPFRRSAATSPYRSQTHQSPCRGKGFPGTTREAESFKANKMNSYCKSSSKSHELFSHRGTTGGSRPLSPTVEKTVHMDTETKVSSKSGPLGFNGYSDSVLKYYKTMSKSREMRKAAPTDSCFEDAKFMKVPKQDAKLENKSLGDIKDELCKDAKALVCITSIGAEKDQIHREDDPGNVKNSLSSLVPTLPKTPSESWLWRTLPSISTQHSFSHPYRGTSVQSKWQGQDSVTPPPTNSKWETIVKSSYSHHDHVRYSEELVPHSTQQSKS